MDSDHRADLLGDMDEGDAEAILSKMDPEEAKEARDLLRYQPDVAGGIMVTEFAVYSQNQTVQDVLDDLRTNAEAYSDIWNSVRLCSFRKQYPHWRTAVAGSRAGTQLTIDPQRYDRESCERAG